MGYFVRFFIGKGGVGKTTSAAAYAVKAASMGYRTLIVSIDPAHNLGDVFGMELEDKPVKICENLWGIEVDYDSMIKKHLEQLSDKIKDIYGYLKIFNLEKYIDVLKHSPGVEEQASLEKIIELVKEYGETGKADIIVFDTPPTGLTLRIMALPMISLIWIDKLLELRIAILERRKAIARITGEHFEIEIGGKKLRVPEDAKEDPVYNELIELKKQYTWINNIITDPSRSFVALVVNPELLPILEAYRAYNFLKRINVPVKYLIINKILKLTKVPDELLPKIEEQEKALAEAKEKFKELVFTEIPCLPREPRGLDELRHVSRYLENIS